MKKFQFTLILFIISIALTACATTTAVPELKVTTEPTQYFEETGDTNDIAMTDVTWEWMQFTDPAQQFEVSDPGKYTVEFHSDGTLNVKADCNLAQGGFTIEESSLSVEIGPMTLAACPPESRSDDFVKYLGFSANYFFEDGNLYIDLMADGGTLVFSKSDNGTQGALPVNLVATLDEFLQSQVYSEGADPKLTTPGLVLLVDTPDGRYLQAAGVSSIEKGTPMQTGDILEIGSNSKSFTIVLLMQLQEKGILSLEDPLSKWLPDQAAVIPNGELITLRQLAQHTSGIWDYADDIIGGGVTDLDKLVKSYTPEELVQYALENGTPDFAPGEEGKWKYSNTGYILLGMVIEAASGEKIEDLYQTQIFDPLGLESAIFIEGVPETGKITNGYWWTDEGVKINTTSWNVSQGWVAGGIAMTAEDLLTYGKALSKGEFFQNPDSLTQMLSTVPSDSFLSFGLGLIIFDPMAPGFWGHEGQTVGFQSLWYTNPDTNITVIGLTNSGTYSAYTFLNLAPVLGATDID